MSSKKSLPEIEFEEQTEVDNTPQDGQHTSQPAKNGKQVSQPFDPTQYLSKFDGRDYLEVKWRLLWLRSQQPDARIGTDNVQHNEENGFARFRAEADIPGGGQATGWGSEPGRDLHHHLEAAAPEATGRCLSGTR